MSDNERDRSGINIVFALCRSSFTDETGEWRAEVEGGEARDTDLVYRQSTTANLAEKKFAYCPFKLPKLKGCLLSDDYLSLKMISVKSKTMNNVESSSRGRHLQSLNSWRSRGWTNSGLTVSNHQNSSAMNTITLCCTGSKKHTF